MRSRSRSKDLAKKIERARESREHVELKKKYAELSDAYYNFKKSEGSYSRSRSRSQPYGSRREVETADDSAIISVNTHLKENPYRYGD
jgi:hypothetical protein